MKRHINSKFPTPRSCANVCEGSVLANVDAFNNVVQCSLLRSKKASTVQGIPREEIHKKAPTLHILDFDYSMNMSSLPNKSSIDGSGDRRDNSVLHEHCFVAPEVGATSYTVHSKKHHSELSAIGGNMSSTNQRRSEKLFMDKSVQLGQTSLLEPFKACATLSPRERSKRDMMDAFSPEFSRGLLDMPSFGESKSFNDDMVVDFTPKEGKSEAKLFTQMKPVRRGRRSSWHCDDKLVVQTVLRGTEDSEVFEEEGKEATLEFVVGGEARSAISWIKSPPISRPTLAEAKHQEGSLFASNVNLTILDELAALPPVDAKKHGPRRCAIDMPSFSDSMSSFDGMGLPMDLDDEENDGTETFGRLHGSCWHNAIRPRGSNEADNDLPRPRLNTVRSGEEMDETMANLFAATGFAPRLAAPPPTPLMPEGAEPYAKGRSESITTEDAMAAAREVGAFWERHHRQGSFTSRGSFASRGSFTSLSRSGHNRQRSGSFRRRSSRTNSFALDEALRLTETWGGHTGLGRSESVTTVEAANAARDAGAAFQWSRSSILSRQDSVATMATVHSDGSCSSNSDDEEESMGGDIKEEQASSSADKVEIDLRHADFQRSPSNMFASPEPNEGQTVMEDAVSAAIQAAAGAVRGAPMPDGFPKTDTKRRGAITKSEFRISPGRTEQDYITPDNNRTILTGFGESRQQNLFLPRLSNGSNAGKFRTEKNVWTNKPQRTMLPSCDTDETQDSSESDDIHDISEELRAFDV